jgi:hypothetical protein
MSTMSSLSDSLTIVVGMLNDRTGLWLISPERVSAIREKLSILSQRSKPVALEMIAIADGGGKFWPTQAEYYAVLSEIKKEVVTVNKEKVDAAIAAINKGARLDNVSDRPWVKQALDVLSRISSEKRS